MHRIPTPKKINFQGESEFKGKFVIAPLYPGYGITIGNALRRVLLSSIPGAAITSVKINGVDHEFSVIQYVKEDVVDILLNFKQVNLEFNGEINEEEPVIVKINKKGEGPLKAGDLECPSQVRVANPDLVIATLTDKAASFEAECHIGTGVGYLPTESIDDSKLEIGYIALDAIFTPIEHVGLSTEHVRVGEMTNWDKLIMELHTNGTITCEDAFNMAVNILSEQFSSLNISEEATPSTEIKKEVPAAEEEEVEVPTKEEGEDEERKKRGRPKKED